MKEDWVEVELGKACYVYPGIGFPKSIQGKIKGKYPFFKVGDISKNVLAGNHKLIFCDNYIDDGDIKNIKSKILPANTVVFAKIGEALKLNRRCLTNTDSLIDNNVIGIKGKKYIDDLFLYYFTLTIKLENYSRATTVPSVRKTDIEEIKIHFPPLPLQRTIVQKIENYFDLLDKGIAELKTAQEQLKIYRQAVLKKAFEGGLTNSKMKFLKLVDITTILGDGLHGTPKYSKKGEYYFINGNNLSDGKILIKPDTKKVDEKEFEKYKKELNQYTVLVSINGTIGNTAFYNNEPVILGKSACYFNAVEGISKEYIRYNLTTSEFLNYAITNATGSTIKNVSLKTMRNYLLPVPINKNDQRAIVREIESRLSVCDKVEENISEAVEKAEALRQSILKKAFEGKLLSKEEIAKCKQEPDYEPASVLLEKIRMADT